MTFGVLVTPSHVWEALAVEEEGDGAAGMFCERVGDEFANVFPSRM